MNEYLQDREYAVLHQGDWHIGTWDGDCFCITSDFQSGDRWTPNMVQAIVLLPLEDYYKGAVDLALREASINADRTAGVSPEDLATMRAMDREYRRQRNPDD